MVDDRKQHKKKQLKKKTKREESDSSTSYSDSESSDSEADRKRSGKTRKEKDRSRRRKDKRHHDEEKRKKRKKKSRRHSSDDESESSDTDEEERRKKRKLLKEAKRILKEHKKAATSAGSSASKVVPKILTEADYFEKNKEFSTWLKEERGIYFSSLSAEDTRGIFLEFIEAWNSGKISEKLYKGVDSATRTDHKWKIRHDDENLADKEEELEFIKKLEKSKMKQFRKENEDLMDELLPKATGRERLLEKKAIRRENARNREDSPEIFKERDIMGGGDDFKQRLERERARREKKASERSAALAEKQLVFDQKESAAMNQLKSLIDTAGGRITIPKRTN